MVLYRQGSTTLRYRTLLVKHVSSAHVVMPTTTLLPRVLWIHIFRSTWYLIRLRVYHRNTVRYNSINSTTVRRTSRAPLCSLFRTYAMLLKEDTSSSAKKPPRRRSPHHGKLKIQIAPQRKARVPLTYFKQRGAQQAEVKGQLDRVRRGQGTPSVNEERSHPRADKNKKQGIQDHPAHISINIVRCHPNPSPSMQCPRQYHRSCQLCPLL